MILSPKHLIGLTGNIASGKSTVLKTLAGCGAQTFCADEVVQKLYRTQRVRCQLKKWFGSAEPKEVAKMVFSNAASRRKLEKFLHPLVWDYMEQQLKDCPKNWAVVEAPLLLEAGWNCRMDLTVLVVGGARTLSTRLRQRKLSKAEYERRLAAQWPVEKKIGLADVIIYNDGSKRLLTTKAKGLYQALENFYA